MKKTTRKTNKNPDRGAKRAAIVKVKLARRVAAIEKREKEVARMNKLMGEALTRKREEAQAKGEEFDPALVIQEIMEEAKANL